ncbi:hypothetical protein E2I00_007413 [Balaenoptera physalus]|uniref:Peptidase M60 domain-containing protein n=1 Tax=Balaenoptera physalus TaxID=9770 RepID=A0A6A1Q7T2_BALPH|nr:hypothetical protein E2I00_007413 [Balaenoptera physalus]
MGATAMPRRQGRRHKEVLSPAKRRPSGSRSRPGGSGEEETSPEPAPPLRSVSAQLARPAPLAGTPLPRRILRLPLPPALLPAAALEVAGRPGEWPSPNAPQAGPEAGGRGLSSGKCFSEVHIEEFRLQRDLKRGARGEEAEGFCEYASTDIHTFLCCVQVQVRICQADPAMATPSAAFEALMNGVTSWDVPEDAIPCELLLIGEASFPVMVNDMGQVLIAASSYGRGRLVVVSHEDYLVEAQLTPFLLNAVGWLCSSPGAPVGVHPSLAPLAKILEGSGVEAKVEPEVKDSLGVYCIDAYSETMTEKLVKFMKRGGGLLIGGQAWDWANQGDDERVLFTFPGNLVTSVAGVYFTDNKGDTSFFKVSKKMPKIPVLVSITSQSLNPGPFRTPKAGIRTYHFRSTLAEFQVIMGRKRGNVEKGWLAKLGPDGAAFLQIPAEEIPAYTSVHRLLRKLLSRYRLPVATRENPVINDCCRGAMLSLATGLAHSGSDLSLLVPEIEDMYCWMSTGLYIPGRQIIEVSLPEAAASADLKVQIGCHTDDLTRASKLFRGPLVINRCCLDKPTKLITCLWGGLLYIIVPQSSKLGSVPVTVKGAVHAPYYRLGETSQEEWKRRIQENPGPWGELATDNIILTVPTANLRTLENPEPLLRLWDESVQELISEKLIRTKGLWGPVHELGRNQQRQEWEFPPHTTEATCNLWFREKRVRIYLGKGPNVKNWNAWTALETYLQVLGQRGGWWEPRSGDPEQMLQEAFGWEPFIRLFTEYRNQTNLPTDNVDKMNLWVKMFSHQVQKNLAPFFEAWAWPIQKEVATSLAYLPEWKENIMKLYLLTQM